jgi:hypothetical protein
LFELGEHPSGGDDVTDSGWAGGDTLQGPPAAGAAGRARALTLDVVDVNKIAQMLEQAVENQQLELAVKVVGGPARFARDAARFGVIRTGTGQKRWMIRWNPALNPFDLAFDGRLTAAGSVP